MPCSPVRLPDGTTVLVHHEKPRPRACSVCKRKTSEYKLCDFPTGVRPWGLNQGTKTCDVVLCVSCAVHRGENIDYCPLHAAAADGKLRL